MRRRRPDYSDIPEVFRRAMDWDEEEAAARGEVDEKHDRHLPLFGEHLDVGVIHPRADVPVDEANVIARLVLAHFAKRHPAAFEHGVVAAGELVVGEPRRVDLDLFEFLDELARDHGVLA